MSLEFLLLGPVEVRRAGAPLNLGGPLRLALLADLLIHEGQVVSVEQIVDDLWALDAPASARARVQSMVHGLRRALGEADGGFIETRPPGYRLIGGDDDRLDLRVFEKRLASAREHRGAGRARQAAEDYRVAEGLWRGTALAGVKAPFARTEAVRLENLRMAAVQENVDVELQLGHHLDVVPRLQHLVEQYPLRESFRAQLMLALHRCGRRADALAVYAQGRRTLIEELGLEPGKDLTELQQALLRGDAALEWTGPVESPAGTVPAVPPQPAAESMRAEPPAPVGALVQHPAVAPLQERRSRRTAVAVSALALAVLIAVVGVAVDVNGRDRVGEGSAQPGSQATQVVQGPSWVQPPTRVPASYFGVTIGTPTGAMPDFQVGAVRLWDSRTRWANLEPQRGQYSWTILDRLVGAAAARRLPVLYTFGGTPGWAAPGGPRSSYDDDSRTAPPDSLSDWTHFVRAVAHRYRGRIEAYELWNLANSPRYYTGDIPSLVAMTEQAAAVIRAVDPQATILCPGMGELWDVDGRAVLSEFALEGGYQHCDAAAIKLFPRQPGDPPESMVELGRTVDATFHLAGVHPAWWNTGTTWRVAIQEPLDEQHAIDFATRFYLVGLYLRVRRMYFYSWGNRKLPVVLQAEGGPPTAAALAVQEVQRWTAGRQLHSCGSPQDGSLPTGAWQCMFRGPGGERAAVRWTERGVEQMRAEAGVVGITHVDGTSRPVHAGESIEISEEPVLVRYAPAS